MTVPQDPPKLMIVIASTRPGRAGRPIGDWFVSKAREHGTFEVDVADLAEINLPFMDEPNHPRLRKYTKQHTRDWSARVDAADAFVFVTPEYNHGMTAPLKNAIDYLNQEWQYKPLGFVSYGGVAAGTRAVQAIKPVANVLKMTPIPEAVVIPLYQRFMTEDGAFQPEELIEDAAITMLNQLERWSAALRQLRETAAQPA
jgi:NAD(P)H-dependent FMN reductase